MWLVLQGELMVLTPHTCPSSVTLHKATRVVGFHRGAGDPGLPWETPQKLECRPSGRPSLP